MGGNELLANMTYMTVFSVRTGRDSVQIFIDITHLQYLVPTKRRVLLVNDTWTAASILVTDEGKPKSLRGLG